MRERLEGMYRASLTPMRPRSQYIWEKVLQCPIRSVTSDQTPSEPTMSHLRLRRSAMLPAKGLTMAYTQRKMAMSRPKFCACCSSVISAPMAVCMVESIWRSR